MPARCHCDVCRRTVGPEALDGYCGFCGAQCYPAGEIGGRSVRLAMSPESRRMLHDRQNAPHQADGGPIQDPNVLMKRVVRETQRRVVNAAVDAATPLVEQGVKAAFRLVRKRLGGR